MFNTMVNTINLVIPIWIGCKKTSRDILRFFIGSIPFLTFQFIDIIAVQIFNLVAFFKTVFAQFVIFY